ncbi:hypothetical protein XBJ2_2100007 [Xenorhabdus bovienii str. Jollieti]|uniref:Uncharacterized protein n=1 Tax=Xenorhabdus bovienii (strain SS-2004) TaxID=406818 RepID=D3V6G7_XENBS|nr:hypothetical protein XBJ1_4134 [Xenorhabdus bovienii SS-2004]CDH29000.1 hypothetical protein XBJ2_2100007 [Xenorhabdus bovienii str. Jollieti]
MVEHDLAKVGVASSSLVSRSNSYYVNLHASLLSFHISDDLFHLLFAYHIFLFVTKKISSTITILFRCIEHR